METIEEEVPPRVGSFKILIWPNSTNPTIR